MGLVYTVNTFKIIAYTTLVFALWSVPIIRLVITPLKVGNI